MNRAFAFLCLGLFAQALVPATVLAQELVSVPVAGSGVGWTVCIGTSTAALNPEPLGNALTAALADWSASPASLSFLPEWQDAPEGLRDWLFPDPLITIPRSTGFDPGDRPLILALRIDASSPGAQGEEGQEAIWLVDWAVLSWPAGKLMVADQTRLVVKVEKSQDMEVRTGQSLVAAVLERLAQEPAFPSRGKVIDLYDGEVVLQIDTRGIVPGDELLVEGRDVILLVKESLGTHAMAWPVKSSAQVQVNDVVVEVQRLGLEIDTRALVLLPFSFDGLDVGGYATGIGLRFVRGFDSFRPRLGLDMQLCSGMAGITGLDQAEATPIVPWIGGEFLWHLGDLRLAPSAGVGTVLYLPGTRELRVAKAGELVYVRTHAALELAWRFDAAWLLSAEAGFMINIPADSRFLGFNAFQAGLGLIWKP